MLSEHGLLLHYLEASGKLHIALHFSTPCAVSAGIVSPPPLVDRSLPRASDQSDVSQPSPQSIRKKSMPLSIGGEALKPSYATHTFKRYIRAADLRDDLKFHSLRHTFATWLLQSGASIYEIQRLLGHYDFKTTQIYAHLMASELHSTVNRISFYLYSKPLKQEPSFRANQQNA